MKPADSAHYQHNPTIPTSEQWNREVQDDFIQGTCIEKCHLRIEQGVACLTFSALITAQQAHRTHWPRDGPIYVNYEGIAKCSRLEGYCEIKQ